MKFNALKYLDDLKDSGIPTKQAEAQVRVLSEIVDGELATKRDIKALDVKIEATKAELKRDIKELEASTKRDIKALDVKIEATKAELKRDIKALDVKIEATKAELKRDIKELDTSTKRDFKALGISTKRYFNEYEYRLIFKLTGVIAALLAIFRFLPAFFQQ